jgi:hypothetical protein
LCSRAFLLRCGANNYLLGKRLTIWPNQRLHG